MKRLFTKFLCVPAYSPGEARLVDLERLKTALKLFAGQYEYLLCSFWLMAPLLAQAPTGFTKILLPFFAESGASHDFLYYRQRELLRPENGMEASAIAGVDLIVARDAAERDWLAKTDAAAVLPGEGERPRIAGICAAMQNRRKRVLVIIDYPFWMVRYGGHTPGFLVMANYLKKRYSLEIFFHGFYEDWERQQAARLGLADNIYPASDYQDDDSLLPEPDEHDFLPRQMRPWYKDYHYRSFAKFLAGRPEYDAVIVFTIFNAWLIKALPYNALTILDTHDFWSLRNYIYGGKEGALLSAAEEAGICGRYDASIFVEESETRQARRFMPRTISLCCPFTYPAPPLAFPASGLHFGFIAPAHIVDPIQWFMDEVWALQDRPDARLHIFGTVCETIKNPPPNAILHGIVQSEEKIHSYCNVMLNPAFVATGISTKTVMALAYGRPVLATSVGARGVTETTGRGIYVANSRAEFIRGMQLFSHDRGMLEKFSRDALQFSRQVFNVDNAYQSLADLIESF